MSMNVVSVKIAGPAGAGIKSTGLLLSNLLIEHGYNVKDYSEYPSLVRGGHNSYQVSFSGDEILAPHHHIDLFFSLLPKHWQEHQSEFDSKTLIFGDDAPQLLPLKTLSGELGSTLYSNTICLGVAAYVLGLNLNLCQKNIASHFGSESPNVTAFNNGYTYAQNNFQKLQLSLPPQIKKNKLKKVLYDGNEAFGWGFLKGGGNFYAAYPMTPSSGTLHFLAQKQTEYKIQVHHPEDEIAAASMIAGASFAGARSATGTSGGGFALMTETISFAGIANLATVFYLVSRPGPATGLPTWTSQGDLLFAVNSGHGEFPKIVLAPGNQFESFEFSTIALNLAAKYNLPVIVLSDKYIAESGSSMPDLSLVKSKIILSQKPVPGTKDKEYLANSYEHDDLGFSTEDSTVINKMVKNRLAVISKILTSLPKAKFYGNDQAKKLIIIWGSPTGPVLEALKDQSDYGLLQIRSVWPIDPNLKLLIKPFKDITVIENNATSQLTTLLKSQFDFNPSKIVLKFDGRPFFPEEIKEHLKIL